MTYLRFTPTDCRALRSLYRELTLSDDRPHFIKRLLVMSLTDSLPQLAGRIASLNRKEFRLLLDHLRPLPQPAPSHGLTPEHVEIIAGASSPLPPHTRYAHLLQCALARLLAERRPDLAMKVASLSFRQFKLLCEEINGRVRGD